MINGYNKVRDKIHTPYMFWGQEFLEGPPLFFRFNLLKLYRGWYPKVNT